MKKQTIIGVFIGLLIGASATYLWCPRNCSGAISEGNTKSISSDSSSTPTWSFGASGIFDKDNDGKERVLPRKLLAHEINPLIGRYRGNGSPHLTTSVPQEILKGWFVDTLLINNLLKPVDYNGQSYNPCGFQVMLAQHPDRAHTLVWGSVINAPSPNHNNQIEQILVRENLWDYINPCPNQCTINHPEPDPIN